MFTVYIYIYVNKISMNYINVSFCKSNLQQQAVHCTIQEVPPYWPNLHHALDPGLCRVHQKSLHGGHVGYTKKGLVYRYKLEYDEYVYCVDVKYIYKSG